MQTNQKYEMRCKQESIRSRVKRNVENEGWHSVLG